MAEFNVFHVTSRGVARQPIYADDRDRRRFVALLHGAQRANDWLIYAYCLMGNHYHAIVHTELERLSHGMHFLNFRYAQGYNARHDRVGHLFQGRFDAKPIAADEHLSSACAYVLDNAVRAGLCATRDDWPWLGGELLADLRF